MKVVNLARILLVLASACAAIASTSSQKPAANAAQPGSSGAPQPSAMDPVQAMGLWKSSFGAVKIETDVQGAMGAVHGVWIYDRNGQEVIGYFTGPLNGNVLEFSWQEPAADGTSLTGAGYLVFDPYGQRFSGKWWTNARDRQGEWTGWRPTPAAGAAEPAPADDGYVPPPAY